MNNFHQFDPWDMITQISTNQAQQQQQLISMVLAHNVSQEQISELIRQQHTIMRNLSALSTAVSHLAKAIEKERT